jgi:dihydrofolate synthase / folylpolyglutamate synthase
MKGYSGTLDYLYGLEKFGIVLGLDSVRQILSLIDNPHEKLKIVHIAGTNGKGSVAAMISSIAQKAGYRAGSYTSPHLVSFTERISVNGERITEQEVVDLTQFIRERIESRPERLRFTFFDFTTALALEYFRRKAVELVVLEVGLGGRLDSTNVVTPVVGVITNVALDHQEYLGNTIEEIAAEKAGIAKAGVPLVTGATGVAATIISETPGPNKVLVIGRDFTYAKEADQTMSFQDNLVDLKHVKIGLRGDHQLANSAVALSTVTVLNSQGFSIDENAVREGLESVFWPARLELLPATDRRPAILLDGAHNPDGALSLAAFLRSHRTEGKRILLFGVMKDKDYENMLVTLLSEVDSVILTKPDIDRAATPADLAHVVSNAITTDSVKNGLERAFRLAKTGDLVIVAGSFYTIGEVKSIIDEHV